MKTNELKKLLNSDSVYNFKTKKIESLNLIEVLSSYKYLLLYTYPKVDSKVCSLEIARANTYIEKFKSKSVLVVGISIDEPTRFVEAADSKINHYQIVDTNGELSKLLNSKFLTTNFNGRNTIIFDNDLNQIFKNKVNVFKKRDWESIYSFIK